MPGLITSLVLPPQKSEPQQNDQVLCIMDLYDHVQIVKLKKLNIQTP